MPSLTQINPRRCFLEDPAVAPTNPFVGKGKTFLSKVMFNASSQQRSQNRVLLKLSTNGQSTKSSVVFVIFKCGFNFHKGIHPRCILQVFAFMFWNRIGQTWGPEGGVHRQSGCQAQPPHELPMCKPESLDRTICLTNPMV